MLSNGSNTAANVVIRETLLLRELGAADPEGRAELLADFEEAPPARFPPVLERALVDPVRQLGLESTHLRRGSFLGRHLRARMPGRYSVATARGLVEVALRIEQGRVVDRWSSRELKRLLFLSEHPRRYPASQLLRRAGLVFKSGTLYSCGPGHPAPRRYRAARRSSPGPGSATAGRRVSASYSEMIASMPTMSCGSQRPPCGLAESATAT